MADLPKARISVNPHRAAFFGFLFLLLLGLAFYGYEANFWPESWLLGAGMSVSILVSIALLYFGLSYETAATERQLYVKGDFGFKRFVGIVFGPILACVLMVQALVYGLPSIVTESVGTSFRDTGTLVSKERRDGGRRSVECAYKLTIRLAPSNKSERVCVDRVLGYSLKEREALNIRGTQSVFGKSVSDVALAQLSDNRF
jgi:hypothetical protein